MHINHALNYIIKSAYLFIRLVNRSWMANITAFYNVEPHPITFRLLYNCCTRYSNLSTTWCSERFKNLFQPKHLDLWSRYGMLILTMTHVIRYTLSQMFNFRLYNTIGVLASVWMFQTLVLWFWQNNTEYINASDIDHSILESHIHRTKTSVSEKWDVKLVPSSWSMGSPEDICLHGHVGNSFIYIMFMSSQNLPQNYKWRQENFLILFTSYISLFMHGSF